LMPDERRRRPNLLLQARAAFPSPRPRARFSQGMPSLRAQRSNPSRRGKKEWIASSLRSSQ
jgi:hypothetical protein